MASIFCLFLPAIHAVKRKGTLYRGRIFYILRFMLSFFLFRSPGHPITPSFSLFPRVIAPRPSLCSVLFPIHSDLALVLVLGLSGGASIHT